MGKDDTLIIVLSRNYSNGLAVARSLGAAGYTVDFIASSNRSGANDIAKLSKYVRNFTEVVARKVKEDDSDPALIEAIMKYAAGQPAGDKSAEEIPADESRRFNGRPVLFPTDDYTTAVIDGCRDELSRYFLMPYVRDGRQGDLARLMDKTVQVRMAEELGLNVPVTKTVSLREEDIELPEGIIYPCYVKPIRSIEGYKTEMAVCADEAELREHLGGMRRNFARRDVIVQEYLRIDQEYASAGICLDQEVILPALIRKTRVGQHGRGVTLTGDLVPFDVLGEDVCEKARRLLRSFNYTGNFGMEFNVVGDKVYFNEVNLRSAGESYAYYKSGANFPLMFVEALQGDTHTAEEFCFSGMGKTLLYDKIAWEDYAYGYLSESELDECMDSADINILCDDDDPEPGDEFMEVLQARHDRREEREKREQRKENCIKGACAAMGWTREQAVEHIEAARKKLDITYRDYRKYEFWTVPEEEQESEYEKILSIKAEEKAKRDAEKPLVVVLSRIYSTGLAVIRSLGSEGYPVDLVGNSLREGGTQIAGASKYVNNYVEVISRKVNGGGDRRIVRELLKYRDIREEGQRIVLFPTDDYTASVMDANRRRLRKIFIMPSIVGGRAGAMTARMSKVVQSRMARNAGLLMPEEWTVSLREEEIVLPEDIRYPVFCKPIESITGYKKEMKMCEDEEQLTKHLRKIRSRFADRDVLVQEFLNIDYEIDMSGVCFDQEIIIPAIIKKTQVAQHERGVTLAGRVVPFEELDEKTRQSVVTLMQMFRYTGMFDLELNVVGDKIYFNEVNLRSGGPNYSYFMSGVNLPVLTVKGLLRQPYDESETRVAEYGKSFIYEKVAWDDYAACFIDKKKLNDLLESADIRLIESEDDPVPTQMFNEMTQARAEARRERRIKKAEKKKKEKTRNKIKKIINRAAGNVGLALRGYPQGFRRNRRDPNAETGRVLIAGRNWCSNLCMAKSVSYGGYETEILRIVQRKPGKNNILKWLKPEKYSKYVKAFYFLNSKKSSRRIVNRLIEIADPDHKMLLIPADDLVAYVIDQFYDELSEYYLMPSVGGKGGGVIELMSKEKQKDLARKAGLPVIHSCVISSEGITEGDEIKLPPGIHYPCFIKPNISRNSSKSKMMKCESEEELLATLEERRRKGYELLVEDFVEIRRELSYLGLSTEDGVVCPGYFEAVVEGEGAHRGVALLGRLLPTEEAEPLMSDVVRFIESLGFNGLFDVDLIETTDGKVYFVELNMRYGASGFALTRGGANLPAMFADYMMKDKPIDKDCRLDNIGQTFTSEKVLIDEYREGILEFEDIDRLMGEADIHFIMDDDDPKPYRHLVKHYATAKRLREESERRAAEKAAREAELAALEMDDSVEADNQ